MPSVLSLLDLSSRIRSGALAPEDAVRSSLDAIVAREGEVGAFAHLDRAAKAGGAGPLRGIAVAVKDIIDTADMPTGMGSPVYAGWRPKADAAIVQAIRRAGGTIVGKTTTTAFASGDPTATRNPRNLGHTPGGSSAGSAAAVGAGMVPLALGTQTAGSVIRPAAYCGAAAIKPSFRLLPTVGVKCLAWTLDTLGLFAAGIEDVAYGLAVLSGRDIRPVAPARPRVGIVVQDFAGAAEPAAEEALARAASLLEGAGVELSDLTAPVSLREAWAAHPTIQDHEARIALAWEYATHRDRLPPKIRANLDRGEAIDGATYDDARRVANRARRDAKLMFAEVDAIIAYAAPGAAPATLATTGDPGFNRLWTMLGTPCVNVPGLVETGGLPVGVQVIAPFARDDVALGVARILERSHRG